MPHQSVGIVEREALDPEQTEKASKVRNEQCIHDT